MSRIKSQIKVYNEITNFIEIARRYFINNFYDGALTILGILLGFFVVIVKNPSQSTIPSVYIILPGLGTTISMFMSGISGSYLSERAEQKKLKADLALAMGIIDEEVEEENQEDLGTQEEELKKAMLKPVRLENNNIQTKAKKKRKIKTIHDKAESFSEIIVAFVNGAAPFSGGVVPLIPFFFVKNASFIIFIFSFLVILLCIIVLGIFVGRISKESIAKNILQMLFAFTLTFIIVVLFLG
jgi:VIT1/CCC1 family predicted Fe2+/Mn2+ transporter